jgi:3-hydroxyisobutyrate dehydrogenase-like beta-hydroxyacid dehydrogenase
MNTLGFIGLGTMRRPMADLGREIKRSAECIQLRHVA